MTEIQRLFAQWPSAIERKGSVMTSFGDSIPFSDYLMNGQLILLMRPIPDAQGTRRTIISITDIVSVKFQDAIEPERFMAMGFQRPEKCMAAAVR